MAVVTLFTFLSAVGVTKFEDGTVPDEDKPTKRVIVQGEYDESVVVDTVTDLDGEKVEVHMVERIGYSNQSDYTYEVKLFEDDKLKRTIVVEPLANVVVVELKDDEKFRTDKRGWSWALRLTDQQKVVLEAKQKRNLTRTKAG